MARCASCKSRPAPNYGFQSIAILPRSSGLSTWFADRYRNRLTGSCQALCGGAVWGGSAHDLFVPMSTVVDAAHEINKCGIGFRRSNVFLRNPALPIATVIHANFTNAG